MDSQDARDLDYGITVATSAFIRALGMFSENMSRFQNGESVAYREQDFEDLISQSGVHHNAAVGRWQR